jgi:hypothetical protein
VLRVSWLVLLLLLLLLLCALHMLQHIDHAQATLHDGCFYCGWWYRCHVADQHAAAAVQQLGAGVTIHAQQELAAVAAAAACIQHLSATQHLAHAFCGYTPTPGQKPSSNY